MENSAVEEREKLGVRTRCSSLVDTKMTGTHMLDTLVSDRLADLHVFSSSRSIPGEKRAKKK